MKKIRSFRGFCQALAHLFDGISEVCGRCQYDDCKGYVWLLSGEAKRLYGLGIEILQVNNNTFFLNPFVGEKGKPDIERFKPECPYCKKKRCVVYSQRPLVCRMYPLNFAIEDGTIYLVLHIDCLYARQKMDDVLFQEKAISLFQRLDQSLLSRLTRAFVLFSSISKFPRGKNRYLRLVPVRKLP